MEGITTDQLDIEMNHVPRELVIAHDDLASNQTAGGVFYRSKCFPQKSIEGLARLKTRAKLLRPGPELVVGETLVLKFPFVNLGYNGTGLFEELAIVATGKAFEQERNHEKEDKAKGPPAPLANGKIA